jgi:hypothetical protein
MLLLFIDEPFALTIVYCLLGAAFMPFLGGTLLILLDSRRISRAGRSGWLSNALARRSVGAVRDGPGGPLSSILSVCGTCPGPG